MRAWVWCGCIVCMACWPVLFECADDWKYNKMGFNGDRCRLGSSPNVPCLTLASNATWSASFHLDTLQQYFSVFINLTRDSSMNLEAINIPVHTKVRIHHSCDQSVCALFALCSGSGVPLCKCWWGYALQVTVYALAPCPAGSCDVNATGRGNGKYQAEQFTIQATATFLCNLNSVGCSTANPLLSESDYLYDIQRDHQDFNVTVEFYNFNPNIALNSVSTAFFVQYHNEVPLPLDASYCVRVC